MDRHGNCPECGASWDGGDIPEDMREHYSPPKDKQMIGLAIDDYDTYGSLMRPEYIKMLVEFARGVLKNDND